MARILTQNINFPVVLRVQGWLLMIEAIFMLFPMFVSLASDEQDVAAIFGYSAAITAASGAAMTFGLRRWHRNTSMRKRDGLLLTAIVWLFFSLFRHDSHAVDGNATQPCRRVFRDHVGVHHHGSLGHP